MALPPPRPIFLNFLSLSFLSCKMGLKVNLPQGIVVRIRIHNICDVLSTVLAIIISCSYYYYYYHYNYC